MSTDHSPHATFSPYLHINDFATKMLIKPYSSTLAMTEEILPDHEENPVVPNIPVIPSLPLSQIEFQDPGPSISQRTFQERLVSAPSSAVGMALKHTDVANISVTPTASILAIDQTLWKDITQRLNNQEREMKVSTRMSQVQLAQFKQTLENQQQKVTETNQRVEQVKEQVNEQVKRQVQEIKEEIKATEKQTEKKLIEIVEQFSKKTKNYGATLTGLVVGLVGIIMIVYFLQLLSLGVEDSDISFYDISGPRFVYPS